MTNQFALAIMNGKSSIPTQWGNKSVCGSDEMFVEYAEKRLVDDIFTQRKPVEVIVKAINSKAEFLKQMELITGKYHATQLLELVVACLERWADVTHLDSELAVAQQIVKQHNDFAIKHCSKPLPDYYAYVLADVLSIATYLLTPDTTGKTHEEASLVFKAAMKAIVSQLKFCV
jgi:hypothetical protein